MITNTPTTDCAALIAAAGLSRRMGALKMLLPLGRTTLLRRGVETFLAAGCAPVLVVTGRESGRVAASLEGLAAECVFNPDFATCQMLESVKLGLSHLQGRCARLFFSPGDVPLVRTATVERLLRAYDGAPLCPSFEGRRGHPVLLPAEAIPAILTYAGPGGLGGALEALGGVREEAVDDPGVLLDADTPEDYQKLLEHAAAEGLL